MSNNPQFSVLMSVYYKDDPALFKTALESIYSNTITPSELILVQDGPLADELTSIIEYYHSLGKLKLIRSSDNIGLANSLNIGLKYITTSYVFRADADDYNLPDRFEKQLSLLISGYDLVGGLITEVDQQKNPVAIRRVPCNESDIRRFICKRNPFNHMTVAFRYEFVNKLGGYPNILFKEDYALWAMMLVSGAKVVNIKDILVHATAGQEMYRRRGGLKLIRSEIELQALLVKIGLQPIYTAIIYGMLRSFVYIIPNSWRGAIYEKYLRISV